MRDWRTDSRVAAEEAGIDVAEHMFGRRKHMICLILTHVIGNAE